MPKWTFSGQNGVPGHCMVAQVWKDGRACIEVEPTVDPAEATETARQVAHSLTHCPLLLAACERMWMAKHLSEVADNQSDDRIAREVYNSWLDMRDAMNAARQYGGK